MKTKHDAVQPGCLEVGSPATWHSSDGPVHQTLSDIVSAVCPLKGSGCCAMQNLCWPKAVDAEVRTRASAP